MSDRDVALRILQQVEKDHAYATVALEATDSGFVRTIVLGVLRWRSRLDFMIEKLSGRPLRKLDPIVVQLLRMALFQMTFMKVPAYAAVDETVDAAARHAKRAKGFVNAVLREAGRSDLDSLVPQGDDDRDIALREAHPGWLVARWIRRFGRERAIAICRANQQLSQPDLLVHGAKTNAEAVVAELSARGIKAEVSQIADGMVKMEGTTAVVADLMARGEVYPMDEGSAAVASLISSNHRSVFDAAAAPGGKSLALTMRGFDVVSGDVSLSRLRLLARSSQAMFDRAPRLVVADGSRAPFARRFDAVLLDAPCSATGTIRKSPEIKWRLHQENLAGFAELQKDLLGSLLHLAQSECIYATCSLEPEENEDVVESVLAHHRDFERFDLRETATAPLKKWIEGGVLRLTPESGADGFTAIGLRRVR